MAGEDERQRPAPGWPAATRCSPAARAGARPPSPASPGHVQRRGDQRVGGDVGQQVIAADQHRRVLVVQNDVSDGLWPGRCSTAKRAVAQAQLVAVRSGRVTCALEPKARKAAPTAPSAVTTSGGTPWRSMTRLANSSSAPALGAKSLQVGRRAGPARPPRPPSAGWRISSSPRWSMCWWVMTISSRSSIACPSAASALELVERLAASSGPCRPASAGRPRSGSS